MNLFNIFYQPPCVQVAAHMHVLNHKDICKTFVILVDTASCLAKRPYHFIFPPKLDIPIFLQLSQYYLLSNLLTFVNHILGKWYLTIVLFNNSAIMFQVKNIFIYVNHLYFFFSELCYYIP